MSGAGGRLPGDLLRRLLERVLTRRIFDDLVIPTLADLQHESALVRGASVRRRAFVLVRGHLGVWGALGLCLATWPPRSLRRDWLETDAAGPFLLRASTPRACLVGLGFVLLLGTGGRIASPS
jgi:hypothetical protein